MNPTPFRSLRLALCATAVATVASPALAAEDALLPPERPTTAYKAQIRNTYSITEPGGGKSGGDTLEIRVSGSRLYEKPQIIGETTAIVDAEKREVIEYDEKGTDKVAKKFPLNDTPIPYIGGRSALAAFDPEWPAPKVAGEDKVAGETCTKLEYGNPAENGIAACVSKEGVVLRAKMVFPDFEREFEALDFDAGKQDEKWFRPPEGFQLVDGAGPEGAEQTE